jgi:hypothetical protein
MKDCACVYRIYIGKNKEKAQDRLIEKYQELVASGAKEITVRVDDTTMEGGNGTTYPYRPFERTMNYIIRPVGERYDNSNSDNELDEKDNVEEKEEKMGVESNDGKKDNEKDEQDEKDEKNVDNVQDIRDFYNKLSYVCVCVCVCVCE